MRRPGKRVQAFMGSGRGRRKRPHPTPHHSRPYGYEGPSQATSQKTYLCKATHAPTGRTARLLVVSQPGDTCVRGGRATGMDKNKRILLGIDANFSSATQYALRAANEFFQRSTPDLRLVLLHVIPVPYDTSPAWGKSMKPSHPWPPVVQQRLRAEHALWRARVALQQLGIAPERIELLQRVGTPADEIVKAARELGVSCIIIGSHGNALKQRIRRMLIGSTSRRVLRLASCPVTLVNSPHKPRPRNLEAWYEEAVKYSLHEHPGSLLVFTACDVAQKFAPPKRTVGCQEVDAASRALEQLARNGLLCCHRIKGELRYLND